MNLSKFWVCLHYAGFKFLTLFVYQYVLQKELATFDRGFNAA